MYNSYEYVKLSLHCMPLNVTTDNVIIRFKFFPSKVLNSQLVGRIFNK